jgi:hypothetical protein
MIAKSTHTTTMPMQYPNEFVEKVRTEYYDNEEICHAVECGRYSLGKYLTNEANKILTPEEIIFLFENGDEKEILKFANAIMRRKSIHSEWIRLVVNKISSLGDIKKHKTSQIDSSIRRRMNMNNVKDEMKAAC